VITEVAAEAAIDLAPLPEDVELVRRGEHVVVLNHGQSLAHVHLGGQCVEVPGEDLVIGRDR